ncbi:MAG: PaaI family thioesterase [Burkholderiaceae bacterium]|nr:PaaI family thioesterase [Burkholderiaceae bacterium]
MALSPSRIEEVRSSFAAQGLMRHFQASLDEIEEGRSVISIPLSEVVTQQHGFFHGGVVGALADTACGYAALSMVPPGKAGLTAEYKINLISPADGDRLVAVGNVLKPGRMLMVCQGDVFIEKNGQRKKCAVALMTLFVMEGLSSI